MKNSGGCHTQVPEEIKALRMTSASALKRMGGLSSGNEFSPLLDPPRTNICGRPLVPGFRAFRCFNPFQEVIGVGKDGPLSFAREIILQMPGGGPYRVRSLSESTNES